MKSSKTSGSENKGGTLSSVQFFNALNKYIPALVLQQWIEKYVKDQAQENDIKKKTTASSSTVAVTEAAKEQLPYIQDMETVCLFADISGFTNISEACANLGIRGNEELAFCINRYMEGMAKNLAKYGGDIIKFVGDAMIVMWPRSKGDPDMNEEDEKVTVIRKAIQCAYDIQKEMNNKKIMANVTNLSVKIGIGFGKCALLYVGGVFQRSEFFTVGTAHGFALASEGEATSGGQIIVSNTAFKYVKNLYYDGKEIISDSGHKFYLIQKVIQGVKSRADAVLLKSSIKMDRMTGIQKSLRSCVPSAIMPYLEIGYESYGSETRALTVMFASLGIDLNSAGSMEGINKIQKIIQTVQQQVYRLEGSLNKLVLDDKGSTLICIWGLSPLAHHDDPIRAILAAFNMRRELLKIDNTWCNVGIATGDVFSGVVGTSGSRKEFSCLGDSVNLAARIMYWPMKTKGRGKINCDLRTKNEAMNQITFKYGQHCEFKGKSISIPIFEPIDPLEEWAVSEGANSGYCGKIIPPQVFLKLHYNPLIVQKTVNHRKYTDPFIGNKQFINEIYDQIKDFFFTPKSDAAQEPLNIIIQGENGSGKTHAVRALCEKLQRDQDFIMDQSNIKVGQETIFKYFNNGTQDSQRQRHKQSDLKFPFFASCLNAESRMRFLAAWRPILRNMLEYKRQQLGVSKNELLRQLLVNHLDKVDMMFDVFGIKADTGDKDRTEEKARAYVTKDTQIEAQAEFAHLRSPTGFLLPEKYEDHVTDQFLALMLDFIKDFIGEYDGNESTSSYGASMQSDSQSKSKNTSERRGAKRRQGRANMNTSYTGMVKTKQPCVIIFDQVSLMDEESWTLLLRVFRDCQNICFIMIASQSFQGNAILPKLEKSKKAGELPYFHEEIPIQTSFLDSARTFDMPQLSKKDFKKMICEIAPRYQQTQLEEVGLMTEIVDPATTIKTKEKSDWWVNELTNKYQLHRTWVDVDDTIIDIIIRKGDGVAIVAFQYFYNLLSTDYIEINTRGIVVPKKNFDMCVALQNFTSIPVPSSMHKRRLKNLDNYLKEGRKKNQRKQELSIKGLLLMKAACVIGEEFGTAALKKIIPLRNETHSSILQILKELEIGELIEILDESDPKNIICRFNKSFLRESIYQIMLYKDQKKVLHQQLAEHIQSLPSSVMDTATINLEIERLRQHILIGEDVKDESDLPFKQKYGLIVKQMQCMLLKNNNKIILYKDFVFKQGKKASKKISKRLLLLTPKEISWYHNIKEYESNKPALGIIKVEDIYKVSETVMQQSTYDMDISVTSYIQKGVLIDVPRTIKFGCETENHRHNWISRIEFLKAKAVYENYVNKFVNIQFPLKKEEDVEEDDAEQQKDIIYEKLHQFGKNFKQTARINQNSILPNFQQLPLASGRRDQSMISNQKLTGVISAKRGSISLSNKQSHTYRQSRFGDFEDFNFRQKQENLISAKDLSKKIKQLYNASLICVMNTATVNANKSQNIGIKNKKIGRLPDYFNPEWLSFDAVSDVSAERTVYKQNSNMSGGPDNQAMAAKVHIVDAAHIKKHHMKKQELEPHRISDNSNITPPADRMNQINEQSENSSSNDNKDDRNPKQKTPKGKQNNYTQEVRRENDNIPESKKQRMSVQIPHKQEEEFSRQLKDQMLKDQMEVRTTNENVNKNSNSQGKLSGNSQVSQQLQMLDSKNQRLDQTTLNTANQQINVQFEQSRANLSNQEIRQNRQRQFTFDTKPVVGMQQSVNQNVNSNLNLQNQNNTMPISSQAVDNLNHVMNHNHLRNNFPQSLSSIGHQRGPSGGFDSSQKDENIFGAQQHTVQAYHVREQLGGNIPQRLANSQNQMIENQYQQQPERNGRMTPPPSNNFNMPPYQQMGVSPNRFDPNAVQIINSGQMLDHASHNISQSYQHQRGYPGGYQGDQRSYSPQLDHFNNSQINQHTPITPTIQQEINNQINQGMMSFFANLDEKLAKQRSQQPDLQNVPRQSWNMQSLYGASIQQSNNQQPGLHQQVQNLQQSAQSKSMQVNRQFGEQKPYEYDKYNRQLDAHVNSSNTQQHSPLIPSQKVDNYNMTPSQLRSKVPLSQSQPKGRKFLAKPNQMQDYNNGSDVDGRSQGSAVGHKVRSLHNESVASKQNDSDEDDDIMDPDRNPDDLNQIEINNQIGSNMKSNQKNQENRRHIAGNLTASPSKKQIRGPSARVQY